MLRPARHPALGLGLAASLLVACEARNEDPQAASYDPSGHPSPSGDTRPTASPSPSNPEDEPVGVVATSPDLSSSAETHAAAASAAVVTPAAEGVASGRVSTSAAPESPSASGITAPIGASTSPTAASAGPAEKAPVAPGGPPCPTEMALVRRTCVDRHEAHLVVVSPETRTESVHPYHARPPSDARFEARSAEGVFPQAYISRTEAALACENAGKRLCSYDEWRAACGGKRGFVHPYANRARKGTCNSSKLHLLPTLFGNDPKTWKYEEHFNSPRLNQEPGFLDRTGAFGECVSDAGVFDLVGNLHEWVSGTVTAKFVERLAKDPIHRRKQPWRTGNAIFVGGFYSTSSEHGPGCFNVTIAHEPRYHDYSTGFRCCKTAALPPPPTKRKPKGSRNQSR